MWTFGCPEIVFGEDALSRLDMLAGERAFIVTDANMVKLGLVEKVAERLTAVGMAVQVFDKVEPDPTWQIVQECQDLMLDYQPDWVVGLGGGSSLDAAKAVWFMYEHPDVEPASINPFELFAPATRSQLITIPTTSGTGADVSMGVVLTDTAEYRKLTLISRRLQPQLTIVDPVFVMSLPPHITADTGMDVLSHAIEAYTTPWNNHFTDGLSLKAIELVFDYLPQAYADGQNVEARIAMHNAATIAGIALSNAALALAHSLAHSLGGTFHTPHGRTVGMFLPYTIQFAANGGNTRYGQIANFLKLPAATEAEGAASLVAHLRALQKSIKQPLSIAELGVSHAAFLEVMPRLVENAASDPQTVTTPRTPDDAEFEKLFAYAFEGKDIDF